MADSSVPSMTHQPMRRRCSLQPAVQQLGQQAVIDLVSDEDEPPGLSSPQHPSSDPSSNPSPLVESAGPSEPDVVTQNAATLGGNDALEHLQQENGHDDALEHHSSGEHTVIAPHPISPSPPAGLTAIKEGGLGQTATRGQGNMLSCAAAAAPDAQPGQPPLLRLGASSLASASFCAQAGAAIADTHSGSPSGCQTDLLAQLRAQALARHAAICGR